MILYYVLGIVALVLNVLGRVLILRGDDKMSDGWHRALRFMPGGELLYAMFRWEKARAGCLICAISVGVSLPVAHHFLSAYGGHFANLLAPAEMTRSQPGAASERESLAQLRKLTELKERKLAEMNDYLTQWYQSLTARQGYLCDEMPEETLDYNRMAAAYQGLMDLWKAERRETDQLRARL
jgi:hypothetical protein